ncbi:MAG: polysaccharide biosynthesis/export family protein [Leptolyngbyaceae bacterium]|nr:polysaccharide biosynthesis/export family protein [Leptolyngbyaceae bacterium]
MKCVPPFRRINRHFGQPCHPRWLRVRPGSGLAGTLALSGLWISLGLDARATSVQVALEQQAVSPMASEQMNIPLNLRQGEADHAIPGTATHQSPVLAPTPPPSASWTIDVPPFVCPSAVPAFNPPFTACVPNQYQLSRGDRIQLSVFDAPEYSGEFELLTDGTISLPLAGQFYLQGLTLVEAEQLISSRLARILRRPLVTVRLLEERPLNLAITGQVNRPGAYTVSLAEIEGMPTVTKAIRLAEGIRLTADIRNVQILRRNPYTAQVEEVAIVNLWALLAYGDLTQDIVLQDGDSIVVPEVDAVNYDEISLMAHANLSPEEITVNVVGEVESPGAIQVKPNTPLHQALLAAGGFNNRARRKEVMLVRLNPDGTVTNQEIQVDFSQPVGDFGNPPLMPFDTVVVGRSNFTKVTDFLGQALSPVAQIVGLLNIFGL